MMNSQALYNLLVRLYIYNRISFRRRKTLFESYGYCSVFKLVYKSFSRNMRGMIYKSNFTQPSRYYVININNHTSNPITSYIRN